MGVVRTIIGKIRAKSASTRGEGASSHYNLETTNGARKKQEMLQYVTNAPEGPLYDLDHLL